MSLQQLIDHLAKAGDPGAVMDIRRLVDAAVDAVAARVRRQLRLTQHVEADGMTGRRMIE